MLYIFAVLVGLSLGSFVSVLSYRIPKNIPFVKGRSFCPKCKNKISWYDNIPLFSYLLLRGKCRMCYQKISARYPIIEVVSAIGFVSIILLSGNDIVRTIHLLIVYVLLLTIFIIDIEHQIIPDSLTYILIILTIVNTFIFDQSHLFTSLFSGFLASAFLMFINIFTKGKGMGLGDVKFAIFGGMFVGLDKMPIWLLLSFLTGAILGSILMLFGKAGLKTKIAFGPFLILGLLLTMTLGEKIMNFVAFPFI